MNEEQTQAPVEEVVDTQPTAMPEMPQKKSRLWLKILIPILIVIVLGGLGASAYYYFFATDYEEALMETFENMKDVKSSHFNYALDLAGSQEGNEMTTKVQFTGDVLDKGNDLVDFSTNMVLSSDIGLPSSDTQSVAINASIYYVDEIVYFKLNEELEIPLPIPADLGFLQEKWTTIDIKAAKKEFGLDSFLDDLREQNPQFAKIEDENNQKMKLIEDNWYKIAKENELFTMNSVDTEKVNGEKLYVYDFTINKAGVVPFVKDLGFLVEEEVTEQDVTDINKILNSLKSNNIVFKILAKERLMKQVEISISVDAIEDVRDFEGLDAKLVIDLSNHDQIESISAPEGDQISLEELMEEMMGSMMGGSIGVYDSPIPEGDVTNMMSYQVENALEQDSDSDGINDFYERSFYSTDPNMADTDGDGYNDFQEVEAGFSPLGEGESKDYLSIFPADMDFCTVLIGSYIEQVDIKDPNKLVEQIFEELMKIDKTAMPLGLELNGSKVDQGTLWLDFSSEYGDMVDPCVISAAQEQIKMSFGQIGKSMQILITSDMQYQTVLY
ncbi:hypothetical protein HN958_03040 [Candidatus Falkowbacteria bacterium]|jgi:hypothetical protein|nr:hypothetical protein [Candidatus Falkowbacteria bacterium]MBT7007454.1 hypothetical protein [Candidatus Falkowbacteria bacterium]